MTNDAAQPPLDVREAGLRAVLAFHDRGMTAASLRARVALGPEAWSDATVVEAADSLGYDARSERFDAAAGQWPALPALCATRDGGLGALLGRDAGRLYLAGRDLIDGVVDHAVSRYRLLHLGSGLTSLLALGPRSPAAVP